LGLHSEWLKEAMVAKVVMEAMEVREEKEEKVPPLLHQ
jgi:hypothetical protein